MWSVGISISPCTDAERLGYDNRQVNRVVIRMAQFFLDRDMRVIFGHDWREDGVMRAIADCAEVAASRGGSQSEPRMLNIVAASRSSLSREGIAAERASGGALQVMPTDEACEQAGAAEIRDVNASPRQVRAGELTRMRHCITRLLEPGCRVCLGGRTTGFEGKEPGVAEEARLAFEYRKPLYLLAAFGGATRLFGVENFDTYLTRSNGLTTSEKQDLFDMADMEQAIRLVAHGIDRLVASG